MPYRTSGKITFMPEKLVEGMIREIKRHTKEAALLNAEMCRKSIDNQKQVVTGGSYASLEESTIDIRRARGISGSKPLIATGNLYNSIQVIPDDDGYSVVVVEYGEYQNEGFIPDKIPVKSNSAKKRYAFVPNVNDIPVPSRNFFDTPKAFFKRKEYKNLLKGFEERMKKETNKGKVVRIR
jgi:hypothetical protein